MLFIPLHSWWPVNIKALVCATAKATCILRMWLRLAKTVRPQVNTVSECTQERQTWPHDTLLCPFPLHEETWQAFYSSTTPRSCIVYSYLMFLNISLLRKGQEQERSGRSGIQVLEKEKSTHFGFTSDLKITPLQPFWTDGLAGDKEFLKCCPLITKLYLPLVDPGMFSSRLNFKFSSQKQVKDLTSKMANSDCLVCHTLLQHHREGQGAAAIGPVLVFSLGVAS